MPSRVSALAASLLVVCCKGSSGGSAGSPPSTGGAAAAGAGGMGPSTKVPKVLVFSRTLGYRHESIAAGLSAVRALGNARGWQTDASEAATTFTDPGLSGFNVLLFLNTTGDVLDDAQQGAMQRFIEKGNGYVGVHAASDTEHNWPWYGGLVGAYFRAHPQIQRASILVDDAQHRASAKLSSPWIRSDEWYAFQSNPRATVRVLLRLDEASYAPGAAGMGADHPLAWCHEYGGGRAFYTALGHTAESYSEPAFLDHLTGAIEWAAGAP